jgi:histidine triad (HIT) family protein
MSENCTICDKIEKGVGVIYKDDSVAVIIPPEIVCDGHLMAVPLAHHAIFENVADDICAKISDVANKTSVVLVDALKCTGTNLLVQSGKPAGQKFSHAGINIIPRFDNDNINLSWSPKSLSEEDFSMVELKLKKACEGLFVKRQENIRVFDENKAEKLDSLGTEKNHLIEHLKRIP